MIYTNGPGVPYDYPAAPDWLGSGCSRTPEQTREYFEWKRKCARVNDKRRDAHDLAFARHLRKSLRAGR